MLLKLFKDIFMRERPVPRDRRGVGVVTTWYNRGVPYQSRFLANCLARSHNVHIFAYKDQSLSREGLAAESFVFSRKLSSWKIKRWIRDKGLRVVYFPDLLPDAKLLSWFRGNGVEAIMIINYETVSPKNLDRYRLLSKLICPVKCTYDLLLGLGLKNIHFIRWAADTALFSPAQFFPKGPVSFIHNAGWGGVQFRKNTEAVVKAFDIASKKNKDIRLILKTQKALKEYPDPVKAVVTKNPRIIVNEKDLPLKELIDVCRSCHVSLLPSKWEGIGLPFLESLSMGLPVITVDAPPMNEWVKNGYNGHCCRITGWEDRNEPDLIVKGALVDIDDLAGQILRFSDLGIVEGMRGSCISSARGFEDHFVREINDFTKSLVEG